VGDFRRREDAVEQVLPQIAEHAAAGRRVGLFQAWNGRSGPKIHPGIDACLRKGTAQLIWPGDVVEAQAVQVIVPRLTIPALDAMRPALTAPAWHLVEPAVDIDDYDPLALHTTLERLYDVRPLWHAVQQAAQAALAARVPTASDRWPLATTPVRGRKVQRRARTVVGCLAYTPDESSSVIEPLNEISARANAECRLLMCGTRRSLNREAPGDVQVLSIEGADLARFVAQLDVVVVSPLKTGQLPLRAIAEALAMGVPVLAVPEQEAHLPDGTTILPTAEWPAYVSRPVQRPRPKAECPAVEPGDDLGQRLGLAPSKPTSSMVRNRTKRVLFVTANGVGLGHITRLSAIARRLPARLEPVFATMSQAASVLEDLGFATELLTTYNGKSGKPWEYWTRERMQAILDYHQPAALVLDASNPYSGVVEAAAARPDLKLIWVRRGMWRASQDNSPFLARAPYFDLIIEPDDIAAALDVVRQQSGTGQILEVPPIGLLDEEELLERGEARRALGLPEETAGGSVLIQLGSGTTRDLNRLLARVMDTLYCFQGLEIVLAQWMNTADEYRGRWRDVRLLTGFPIPRYYRAFDFTVSAAGYNSFNDLLRFGVPTIFIANDAECMDDQGARARYAQAQNAAFDIEESNLEALYDCVQAILQAPVRGYLSEQARLLARPNGAAPAARAIARLLN
jgi:UDP:flavonoid glycosyltransferase YjiC (YdhE family)